MWIERVAGWGQNVCGWGGDWGVGRGPWFFGWIIPLLFWGLLAFLLISIIGRLMNGARNKIPDNSLEILRSRFAKGEITEQQYRSMKEELFSS